MVKPNEMFAYQRRITIRLKNELTEEEAKALAQNIHSSLSRAQNNAKPWEIQRISEPETGLINPNTIFKDYLIMDEHFKTYVKNNDLILDAYLYETDGTRLEKIIPQIGAIIKESKCAEKLLSISFAQQNPTVHNDERLTENAISILQKLYGERSIIRDYGQVPYFNDDFAYFQQKVPGVYFFLGGSNAKKRIVAMNHATDFNVDEECIKVGVRSFSTLLIERLNGK